MEKKITLPPDAVSALHEGHKTEAIKLVRAQRGLGLKEAKEQVEAFLRAEPSVHESFIEMRARSRGAGPWWWALIICAVAVLMYFWQSRAAP
jgi:hypothetical protein